MAFYGNSASLCLISSANAFYQIRISLILHAAMFLNMAMCAYTFHAPLLAAILASAHPPQLASQLSAIALLSSVLATA